MKTQAAFAAVAASLTGALPALTIDTSEGTGADTFVETGSATVEGANDRMRARRNGTNANGNRAPVFRFDLGSVDVSTVDDATITLQVSSGVAQNYTMYVLDDGGTGETWDESTLVAGNMDAAGLGTFTGGGNPSLSAPWTAIGSGNWAAEPDGTTINFDFADITDSVNGDTNGLITFALVVTNASVTNSADFSTKESQPGVRIPPGVPLVFPTLNLTFGSDPTDPEPDPEDPIRAPISLEHVWGRLADPAGTVNATVRNGIVSGESAEFSKDGQYIVTTSKADGRTTQYTGSELTGSTSHLRMWDLDGNMIWDKGRSRGPINPTTGRPNDQPASGEDELEVASFSRDDRYVAAGGDDFKVEIWQVRDLVSHEMLAEPILAKTFITGGGVDSMMYSHDGDLLFVGTEEAGKVEVFRVQGDPSTWQLMHKANHGGSGTNGVNSVALPEDDAYVASAGTNQTGALWRLDVTRDGSDFITAVNMVRLASMTEPTSTTREVRFTPNVDNSGGGRNELVAITAEHNQATFFYSLQELIDHGSPSSGPPPIQVLRNYFNNSIIPGNPVEPMAFSPDGRFLLTPGKSQGAIIPAFFRIYETAEIGKGAPEPDPVWVQEEDVRNPEYFDFNPDASRLTSSHHDGSVRLWKVHYSDSQSLGAEGFNETTATADRWTIAGPSAAAIGSVGQVANFTNFHRGHRGSRFIAIDSLGGAPHTVTLNDSWSVAGFRNLQVQFATVARTGQWDAADFLKLEADADADGTFETLVAEFRADEAGDLAHVGTGKKVRTTFTDFFIDVDALLPAVGNQPIRFRIQASTSDGNEELGFDSLRLTGEPIPSDLDSDNDGVPDLFESIAGTDPHDPASRFVIETAEWTGGGAFQTTIAGVRGRSYILQRSLTLGDDWENIGNVDPLTADQTVVLADLNPPEPPVSRAFYRISATAP